jgi:hypothetical protein
MVERTFSNGTLDWISSFSINFESLYCCGMLYFISAISFNAV